MGFSKGSHAILLCRMEQGEVKNCTETEKNRSNSACECSTTPCSTLLHWQMVKSKTKRLTNPCHVLITTRAVVLLTEPTTLRGLPTNISAQLALQLVVRSSPIRRMNVKIKIEKICQKTSRSGYVCSAEHAGSEACPEWKY